MDIHIVHIEDILRALVLMVSVYMVAQGATMLAAHSVKTLFDHVIAVLYGLLIFVSAVACIGSVIGIMQTGG